MKTGHYFCLLQTSGRHACGWATDRIAQAVLILTFIGFSWLGMQAVHEAGHVLAAHLTGAEVIRVALHPLIISRTDIGKDPHPLAVVWGGALFGSVFPLLAFSLALSLRSPGLYLFRFFSGFCLVANGIYIGAGSFLGGGADSGADPWVMRQNGSPVWVLILFGLVATPLGLYLWHRQGPHFGLGAARGRVDWRAASVSVALLLVLVVFELVRNEK